jgi:hypothetical protein
MDNAASLQKGLVLHRKEGVMRRILAIMITALVFVSASLSAQEPGDDVLDGLPSADRRWAAADADATPSFTKHVVPLFNKVGCSNRSCHGSFQGQGGFRLSLFGYDPAADYQQLKTDGGRGLRANTNDVDQSLILRKPLGLLSHGGDEVLEEGSWQHRLLRRWIADAAPFGGDAEPYLKKLEVFPRELRLARNQSVRLRTAALFTDGAREEVTSLTTFASNNEAVAEVTDDGQVTAIGEGDTSIVISYGGGVITCPVIVPLPGDRPFPEFPPNNRVDELVAAKLRKVGIHPSGLSSDEQFLRRVHIDLIGTLPTPDEVRSFLADSRPDKRARVIDQLLDRPEYSLYWASIFSDWTGNNGGNLNPAFKLVWLWHDWLRDKLERNLPYDELIGGILTATSREGRSLEQYVEENKTVAEKIKDRASFDDGVYAQRKTLDLFWLKRSSDLTKELANRTAANFLGVQIQCAECHKHPFDRWTQADFEGFTSFFRIAGQLANLDGTPFNQGSRDYDKSALYLGVPGNERVNLAKHPPKILAGPVVGYTPDGPDPRVALWEWMRSPENPYFARNLVNRFWAHYFSVGIVDPVDDMNAANPPSNPELLDWLAQEFIEHQFDLKHLHRVILNSRTYQLSHVPNETNRLDRRNFSHALVKRMPAEVALDAVACVTGTQLVFNNYSAPPDTRAIGLAPSFRYGRSEYFMDTFGRPPRREICSCERSSDPALAQALYLINDEDIHSRIADPKGRLPRLLDSGNDDASLVEELYLTALSRFPTLGELETAATYIAQAPSREAALQDLVWTMLNVREFLFVR